MAKLMRNMFATHTDYGDFKGLIPDNPAFLPSNVDGIAERNGHFLIMVTFLSWSGNDLANKPAKAKSAY